jgi:hypothetical protein
MDMADLCPDLKSSMVSCLQYNVYLRNVNKVALFKRVVDRQAIKSVSAAAGHAAVG